ncbi:hypothetical protein BDQ12DRAFT_687720 [Crucibulum laeve]|uniref:Uncharacterized protein n=1 Tax=Crucibulum laeve TaxID=68775 RepID=A0A5C3LSX5_9AGAR|nr:hypothetical protein BDQ12DRAFT_687720 [Crucibulum laeve]
MSNPYAYILEKFGQKFDPNRVQKGLVASRVRSQIRMAFGCWCGRKTRPTPNTLLINHHC